MPGAGLFVRVAGDAAGGDAWLMIEAEQFFGCDLRVARVVACRVNERARKPAYVMELDLGPLGARVSSAQLTEAYGVGDLVGRLVIVVVNLPPRNVAGVESTALVLGVFSGGGDGPVLLLSADDGVRPGDRVG